jgi:choline dehydrogenase-like flavoprotein
MSALPDPIQDGLARGWKAVDASGLSADLALECDVVIVGTGAGGGMSAEILARSGLDVVLVEEGPLKSSKDFRMRESDAYPQLYQESAARKTRDKAINILQGRAVGGSTTVNWTASFRTPPATLALWQREHGLADYGSEQLAPWFDQVERRVSIGPFPTPPNPNNTVLQRGAAKLGVATGAIARNVKGCWNLGYCGTGCPTNAKQSMLVTTIPAALEAGARLYTRLRALRLEVQASGAPALECVAMQADGVFPGNRRVRIRARHVVLAGGAINTPALLLRSGAPDPYGHLGRHTYLHPVAICAALMPERVEGYNGAPQTVYSDHFMEPVPERRMGFKLEVPPLHPVIFATTMAGFGKPHRQVMEQLPHAHAILALLRDGFHPEAAGGTVQLKNDGSPVLDYPLTDYLFDGARRALLAMAEIQFAAGAKTVYPVHELAAGYDNWPQARAAILALPMQPLLMRLVSAHVMGGSRLSASERRGVVDPDGVHWQWRGVSVHDGSLFPTSVGANPQESVYAIAARLANRLATRLTGRPAASLV